MRRFAIAALVIPFLTTGCALGEGAAQAVKYVSKQTPQGKDSSQPTAADTTPSASPAPDSLPPIDTAPAPMPSSDQREDVKVEALPPPR